MSAYLLLSTAPRRKSSWGVTASPSCPCRSAGGLLWGCTGTKWGAVEVEERRGRGLWWHVPLPWYCLHCLCVLVAVHCTTAEVFLGGHGVAELPLQIRRWTTVGLNGHTQGVSSVSSTGRLAGRSDGVAR